jgi:hypothetical protein
MELFIQKGARVGENGALDPDHILLRQISFYPMMRWVLSEFGSPYRSQTFLRDTICRLPAPDPLSIVVEFSDLGRKYQKRHIRRHIQIDIHGYEKCHLFLRKHGCEGTLVFNRGVTLDMMEDALAEGIHPENVIIEGLPSLI